MANERIIDWELIRRDFPVTERMAYLNSAAAGPIARPVAEAAIGFYRDMMMGGDARWDDWREEVERARASVARLINADLDEVAFTTNTSTGMNLIVDALADAGEVISCELEFPTSTIPWMHRGVRVRFAETVEGQLLPEAIRRAMTRRTGIIAISHVQYSNGFRADLEEIGRIKGDHWLVVNASQSAGVLPIDVKRMRIDALCATGHKWLCAGYGVGFVYLSRRLLERTKPHAISWMSVHEPFAMRNDRFRVRGDAAARAEIGCSHFAGIFALGAAAEYIQAIGIERIAQRALALNEHLTRELERAGWRVLSPLGEARSAETLVAAADPPRVVAHLKERGIAVTEKPEGFRVATHFFNTTGDITRLIAALGETWAQVV
jgi:selenocysteine lyase/cysteine desulfurase